MDPNNFLNVLNWNARSLNGKEDELFNFLTVHNVHLAVITETYLKPGITVKRNPNYFIYRNDRLDGAAGGVAIIVHRRIKHQIFSSFETKVFETLGVSVETQFGKFTFIAAYLPFQCTGQQKVFLKSDLQKLTRNRSKFFIVGDFNAKHRSWNNSQSNANGKTLFDDCSSGYYSIQYPNGPTCFSSARNPSTIDLVLTDSSPHCSELVTHADFDSDHLPVTFQVSQEVIYNPTSSTFNYHRADWDLYKTHIDNNLDVNVSLETKNDIDCALETLTSFIVEARDLSIPKCQVKFDSVIIDDDLKLLIRLKNLRRRQYQRTRDPTMKSIWHDLQKEIKQRFAALRNKNFENNVSKLNPGSKPFWKLTKILKKPPKPIPALKEDSKILITNGEKAQKLAKQFESAHNFGIGLTSPIENQVAQESEGILNQENVFDNSWGTDLDEIRSIIKKLKNMKAPGDDGIFYILIKKLPESTLSFLVKIFNKCFQLAYFPDKWKNAKVVPILKPDKNPAEASSYRPISLLSSISKLFEKIILSRMMVHINENSIFAEEQFGFRHGHSTTHQLLRVTNLIRNNKSEGHSTGVALLDIEKAFDSVWHEGLIVKLKKFNFPLYIIKLIQSYLTDRTLQVNYQNSKSERLPVRAGVPQGSILGPILYNIFTSDLPDLPQGCQKSLFADDTAISAKGRSLRIICSRLQKSLDIFSAYLQKWKISPNAAKTQLIIFPHKPRAAYLKPSSRHVVTMRGIPISWSDEVKYLGLMLDKNLTFKSHIEGIQARCNKYIKCLYPLVNRKSKLCLKNKLLIYKQIFRPAIMYAVPIWTSCCTTRKKALQRIQNKVLKMILKLPPWYSTNELHRISSVETLEQMSNKIINNFRQKSLQSSIAAISSLYN